MNKKKIVPVITLGLLSVSIFFVLAHIVVITQLLPEHHPIYLSNHPFIILPYAFGECISLPCDDANIKLGEPNYKFIDFSYQNKVGKRITFILEKTAMDECNSYIATITDENGDIVWEQQRESCV